MPNNTISKMSEEAIYERMTDIVDRMGFLYDELVSLSKNGRSYPVNDDPDFSIVDVPLDEIALNLRMYFVAEGILKEMVAEYKSPGNQDRAAFEVLCFAHTCARVRLMCAEGLCKRPAEQMLAVYDRDKLRNTHDMLVLACKQSGEFLDIAKEFAIANPLLLVRKQTKISNRVVGGLLDLADLHIAAGELALKCAFNYLSVDSFDNRKSKEHAGKLSGSLESAFDCVDVVKGYMAKGLVIS